MLETIEIKSDKYKVVMPDDEHDSKLNFIQGHCNKEPFKAGIEGRRYMVADDEPIESGDHDEEMQKIKEVLSDESI